jgi:hypothetical protein
MEINTFRGEAVASHNLGLNREAQDYYQYAQTTSAYRNSGDFWKPLWDETHQPSDPSWIHLAWVMDQKIPRLKVVINQALIRGKELESLEEAE